MDAAIDAQLDYAREQFKWYDTRYAWSTVWTFGAIYFMFANAVPFARFGHSATFWEYLGSILAAFACFGMSIMATVYGMVPFLLWNKKMRGIMGCTSFMWLKNVAAFKNATEFAQHVETLVEDDVRKARSEELWRLSQLLEQRETGLVWARTGTFILVVTAFIYAVTVFSATASLKVPILH